MTASPTTRRTFVTGATFASATAAAQSNTGKIPQSIDAWGHVSLPRFMSAEEYLALMDANNVEAAIVGTAATCPDLTELSRAAVRYGDRLRVIGMAMGRTPDALAGGVKAQMDHGFLGIRVQAALAVRQPAVLDIIGEAGGVPYIEGNEGYRAAAQALVSFLERYPASFVCGTHFAGPTGPAILTDDPNVARLFRHPRFLVIFSRQGYMEPEPLRLWTRAVVQITGWDRVLFGSEFPVALWRDETFRSTQTWIDAAGLTPTPAERNKFLYENSRQRFFAKPRPARPLDPKWALMELKTPADVWLFVKKGMDVPEQAHHKILQAYLAKGGDAVLGSYRDYVTKLMVEMAQKL